MCLRKPISIILIFTNVVFLVQFLEIRSENEIEAGTLNATEQLLELIVKITADPHHWRQALNLIEKTKNYAEVKNRKEVSNKPLQQDLEELRNLAKDRKKPHYYYTYNLKTAQKNNSSATYSKIKKVGNEMTTNNNGTLMRNMNASIKNINLNTNNQQILQNNHNFNKDNTFAYEKFKGQARNYPLLNKRPKAYIAISLIAQKPLREESILDQELKYLKQWPHKVQQK
ncbi:uncharacterized protein LOC108741393 [Agrilus planipennis]|uniref:Uncharacterized protein LOC108741393 n=1 Tax=Agrilus planipennis TaxID=224129 RepID=A0A7F5R6V9_AGRPL|nr:uncharacterized protein LOC108741393 [Agrilus planipennis]